MPFWFSSKFIFKFRLSKIKNICNSAVLYKVIIFKQKSDHFKLGQHAILILSPTRDSYLLYHPLDKMKKYKQYGTFPYLVSAAGGRRHHSSVHSILNGRWGWGKISSSGWRLWRKGHMITRWGGGGRRHFVVWYI